MSVGKKPVQRIQLTCPAENRYTTWIMGNALHAKAQGLPVVLPDSAKGQRLVVCGAGPSLRDNADAWCFDADQVWGCNSAATWLADHGYPVTHAITVDQTADMLQEWQSAPDVEYLLASTVHSNLTEYLLARGRKIRFFHNFVGIKKPPVAYGVCKDCGAMVDYGQPCPNDALHTVDSRRMDFEDWAYLALFPPTVRAGSGLNTVTRAIDVALFMGFGQISVLGADCALRCSSPRPDVPINAPEHKAWLENDVVMHADGGHALASRATPITLSGVIDGREWVTKPDMAVSAVWLRKMARLCPQIRLVGDTLPNAIMDKSERWIAQMPGLVDANGEDIPLC